MTDVQLPDAALSTQRDTRKAAEDRQRAIADAQAYANDIVPKAQAAAQRQLADAQVYAAQTVANADGEAERFTQLAGAYAQAPEVTRSRLYIDTMQTILSRSRKIVIDAREWRRQHDLSAARQACRGGARGDAGRATPPARLAALARQRRRCAAAAATAAAPLRRPRVPAAASAPIRPIAAASGRIADGARLLTGAGRRAAALLLWRSVFILNEARWRCARASARSRAQYQPGLHLKSPWTRCICSIVASSRAPIPARAS
jgi:regulator of protease activity HflC (stomatin/prohibitin superfamily)